MRSLRETCLLLALAAGPHALKAQSAEMWRDSSVRLRAAAQAIRASMLHGDSGTVPVARKGELAVTASPALRDAALALLETFDRDRRSWFGVELPSPGGFRLAIHVSDDGRAHTGVIILTGGPDSDPATQRTLPAASGELANTALRAFGDMMFASAPAAIRTWLDSPPDWSLPDALRHDRTMYAFVTGVGPTERKCAAGDLAACSLVLDVTRTPYEKIGGIYNPFIRADLFHTAIALGGPGAWQRVRSADGQGVAPLLASAGRLPFDSLVARWRSGLLVRRTPDSSLLARRFIASAAWIVVLLAGALGASRWA